MPISVENELNDPPLINLLYKHVSNAYYIKEIVTLYYTEKQKLL